MVLPNVGECHEQNEKAEERRICSLPACGSWDVNRLLPSALLVLRLSDSDGIDTISSLKYTTGSLVLQLTDGRHGTSQPS